MNRFESGRVSAFNGGSSRKIPFSEGFRVLFIGVGGPDLAETSGDLFWHVSGPTRPTPPSFVSIWHRFEVISNPSRNGPIELKLGRNNLYHVWKLMWKSRCIWISGLWDMIDSSCGFSWGLLHSNPSFRIQPLRIDRSRGSLVTWRALLASILFYLRVDRFAPMFFASFVSVAVA